MNRSILFSRLIILLGLTFAINADALTLGKLSVLSSLGQPLIAEIDVPEISVEESHSVRVGMASAEAFKSAGLDYTPAAAQISVVGKRRVDGRAILELRTTQPINAPYLDLVLEVTWNTGRMLRDYTVLLDPPATSTQALVIPAQTLPIQSMSLSTTAQSAPIASPLQVTATEPAPLPLPTPSPRAASISAPQAIRAPAKAGITTKRGDTAAALATNNKPEGVSLDQMLVSMLRHNPDAFVAGNVNRLKSGVLLEMPSTEEIRTIAPSTARSSIQAQAKDFNDYRRKLSSNVVATVANESSRSTSGKVTANVADRQTAPATDDRLTLAKPTAGNIATTSEAKIAQDRTASDAAGRAAELQKNIADLKKMVPIVVASASSPESLPIAPPLPAPVAQALTTPTPLPSLPVRPVPAPVVEKSFLDALILNPLTLPVAGGLGVLVLLTALFGIRRRRKHGFSETQNSAQNFVATRSPSDTIFGPMGANDVDTKESPASTTMVYSPSQMSPTTGDVDPIAEADVYLAYNRDVQAEEILKAAKIDAPKRTDVRVKLLELYAKRYDLDSFNADAQELHMLTDGEGHDWSQTRKLARDIGSKHPLFNVSASAFAVSESPKQQDAYSSNSLSFVPDYAPSPAIVTAPLPSITRPVSDPNSGLIDFNLDTFSLNVPEFTAPVSDLAVTEDPKLALAEEYLSIGDHVGARALIEEVIKLNAQPQVVTLAHQMLARLG